MSIFDYNTSASLNTSVGGINIAPGMARADVDNALRAILADVAAFAGQVHDIRSIVGGDGEISAALTRVRDSAGLAYISSGTYTLDGQFDLQDLNIVAAPDAIISPTGTGTYMFTSTGAFTQIADLSANVTKGGRSLTFSAAHGLAIGDWIVIYNPTDYSFHTSRAYYRAGEWCRVQAVSGLSVTIETPLFADYTAASVDVYKAVLRTPSIRGGEWRHGTKRLAKFTGCMGNVLDAFKTFGSTYDTAYLDRCVSAKASIVEGHNVGIGSDDYAVVIGNSQHVRVTGKIYARRHPVTIGGDDVICGVPNRDVIIHDATLSNDISTNVSCADFHGNAELCFYKDCRIYGGASIAGLSTGLPGCFISERIDGNCIETTEFKGGVIDLRGVALKTTVVNIGGGRGVVDFGSQNSSFNSGTTENVTVYMTDYKMEGTSLAASEALIRVLNSGSTAKFSPNLKAGTHKVTNALRVLFTDKTGGTASSDGIIMEDLTGLPSGSAYAVHSGAYYTNVAHRLPEQKGVHQHTTTATSDYTSTAITYPVAYPRAPRGYVTLTGRDGATVSAKLGGAAPAVPYPAEITSTTIKTSISASANWTAGVNVDLAWAVGLSEV